MDIQQLPKLSWWMLLVFMSLIAGLLGLVHWLVSSPGWRQILDIGAVCFSYGLVALWLRRNTSTLAHDQLSEDTTTIIIIEPLIGMDQDPRQLPADSDSTLIHAPKDNLTS